jgi:chromosome segregation ATPase
MLENQLRDAERITTRLQEEIKQKDQHIRAMAAASEAQSVENSPQYKDMQKRVEEYQNFLGSAKQHIESFQNANTKLSSQIGSRSQ